MGISVTRTIWIEDDILSDKKNGKATAKWEVLNLIKRIPKGTHYTVRYVLDKDGPFIATKKTIMVLINIKTKEDMSACFLPNSWNGKRVRRIVETPVYGNT